MLFEKYFLTGNTSMIKTVVFKVRYHHYIETIRMTWTVNQWLSLFLYDGNNTPRLVSQLCRTYLLLMLHFCFSWKHPKTETFFEAFSRYRKKHNIGTKLTFTCQSQQWKHQDNVWNRFKVNNKDTRTTSMTLFCCLYC